MPALAGVRNLYLDDPSAGRSDSHCNFGDRSGTVQIGYEPELFLRLGERGRLGGSAVLVVHSEFDYRLSCPNRRLIVCSMVSAARAGLGGSGRHPTATTT